MKSTGFQVLKNPRRLLVFAFHPLSGSQKRKQNPLRALRLGGDINTKASPFKGWRWAVVLFDSIVVWLPEYMRNSKIASSYL
jgi:hypothetical protein